MYLLEKNSVYKWIHTYTKQKHVVQKSACTCASLGKKLFSVSLQKLVLM